MYKFKNIILEKHNLVLIIKQGIVMPTLQKTICNDTCEELYLKVV